MFQAEVLAIWSCYFCWCCCTVSDTFFLCVRIQVCYSLASPLDDSCVLIEARLITQVCCDPTVFARSASTTVW